MRTRTAGFTLVELMVTVALAAIVMTLGVPSFQNMIRNNQLATQTNSLVAAINLARSEAVRQGSRVTLCKRSANANSCDTSSSDSGYANGAIIFVDSNPDGVYDKNNEELIQTLSPMSGDLTATGNSGPIQNYISFVSDGTAQKANGDIFPSASVISVCKNNKARLVGINAVGRIKVEEGTCSTN